VTAAATVVAAAQRALAAATGSAVRLGEPEDLGGSTRTVVVRCACTGTGLPASVVVKAHVDDNPYETGVREAAVLELLGGGEAAGLVPGLLAVGGDPPLVVLSDLGSGRDDLSALLLGADPGAAVHGLTSWARALGQLHAATSGLRADVEGALRRHAARLGRPAPPADSMPDAMHEAADGLVDLLPRLDVQAPAAALQEVRHLPELLSDDPRCWVVTPGDTCPDNNVLTASGAVLLDFEGAGTHHLAWDAAYLRVPWPSCWCSWRLPDEVAGTALEVWRDAVAPAVPYVREAGFEADLEVAEAGWAAISASWFLGRALTEAAAPPGPGTSDPAGVAPNRRAVIQHRLSRAAAGTDPRLGGWRAVAAETLAATRELWGRHPLPLAPAFRDH
jgi:hypothetical protein